MESTHPSLLQRVADMGDHAAWREFDARYRDLIWRYCRRKGLQASDAEDVRQLVMLNLAKQLRTFEYRPEKGRFRDYLGRAVANGIHRVFRRPRLESQGLGTDEGRDLEAPPDVTLDREWEIEWMHHHYRRAIEHVRGSSDPRSIEVFEQLLAGRTVEETAQEFRLSRDAVYKVKQRVRDRLKERVAEQVRQDEGIEGVG